MPAAQLTNTLRRRHRVLLIGQDYFVVPELERALRALGVAVAVLPFAQNAAFVRQLLLATASGFQVKTMSRASGAAGRER